MLQHFTIVKHSVSVCKISCSDAHFHSIIVLTCTDVNTSPLYGYVNDTCYTRNYQSSHK